MASGATTNFRVIQVQSVDYDFASASAVVNLREAEAPGRWLRLPVALADATALFQAREGLVGRRPTTSELMATVLAELQADIIAARIVARVEGVYLGELDVMSVRGRRVFDCRPSDAMVLALRQRVKAPLLCAEELLGD